LSQQELLLLLDGLDEVKADYREDCIVALNQFKQDYGAELVVCSRIKDYQALSNRLNFQSAVYLRLLRLEQIYHYLNRVGADLTGLRTLIAEDTVLQELAQSPLMINIMTLAYQRVAVEDLPRTDVVEERRRQLFDAYIERMFKRRKTNQQYKDKNAQVKHWLIWLAQRMVEESQTIFLIEKMQPYWLVNRKQKRTYTLMFWLMAGLMGWLMGWLMKNLMLGLIFGLMFWLMGGQHKESLKEIKTVEILNINWKKILINRLMLGLMFCLMLGLMGWLMEGLMAWLMGWQRLGLMPMMMGSLIVGLMPVMMVALTAGLESSEIERKTSPNQGIWKSARNAIITYIMFALIFALMFALIVGLMFGPMFGLRLGLILGLILGLMAGLRVGLLKGGEACIQHFFLRLVLYRNNCIPWNYARFLEYAADRIFLQKVGGGYIFIHRMLMEHFAEMKPKN
ncbi:MAG: NACHT domain-containing protein, partial [Moorea sp. SIO2I5]|nr:NACHT domain-containing protein [Moorena sp. SIO2I5]